MTLLSKCLFFIVICLFSSCSLGFKGISIPPDAKTFSVENFSLGQADMPIDLNQQFTQELRRKVRQESRLTETNDDPHIVFSGVVTKYRISYVAPDENNTTSLNRLEISLKVDYENTLKEDDAWSKSYTDFEDFDSNINFQDIQEDIIATIVEDILERVFNEAFTDW